MHFQVCNNLVTFVEEQADTKSPFMCSLDIASLLSNFPLDETIDICMDGLYQNTQVDKPLVKEKLLRKRLGKAITYVDLVLTTLSTGRPMKW